MPKYIVNVTSWGNVEAPNAEKAFEIAINAVTPVFYDALAVVAEDVNVIVDEVELLEEEDN